LGRPVEWLIPVPRDRVTDVHFRSTTHRTKCSPRGPRASRCVQRTGAGRVGQAVLRLFPSFTPAPKPALSSPQRCASLNPIMQPAYVNLTESSVDDHHLCCALGDPKHEVGVQLK